MHGLLSIGRFSLACRLSIRTLRRYDADALLVPALVDPVTGRRYYSPAQVGEARLIRLLRDLDLPLEEVRGFLAERHPAAARSRLGAHRDRLARRLAHQQAVLAELDDLLRDPAPVATPAVTRRVLPEQLVAFARMSTTLTALPGTFAAALSRLDRAVRPPAARRAGPTLAVYHGEEFDPDALDLEVAVPVTGRPHTGGDIGMRVLPAVPAATTVHAGPYDGLGAAYAALARWAGEQGAELGPDPRETYLVGPDRCGPAGWRTEVAWPLAETAP